MKYYQPLCYFHFELFMYLKEITVIYINLFLLYLLIGCLDHASSSVNRPTNCYVTEWPTTKYSNIKGTDLEKLKGTHFILFIYVHNFVIKVTKYISSLVLMMYRYWYFCAILTALVVQWLACTPLTSIWSYQRLQNWYLLLLR